MPDQEHLPVAAFYAELGKLLRERRSWSGMTQRELAAQIGSDASRICLIERGEPPDMKILINMAAVFLVSPVALLREAAAAVRR